MVVNSRMIETKLGLANQIHILKDGLITTTYMGFFFQRSRTQCRILRIVQDETDPLNVTLSYTSPNGSSEHHFDWDQRESYTYTDHWGF